MNSISIKNILVVLLFLWAIEGRANVRLPRLFTNNAVLQRDKPITIWGWADPGETVDIQFGGQHKTTRADRGGDWKIQLNPLPAGGPYSLHIHGKNSFQIDSIFMGDVWICSGQSNMKFRIWQAKTPVEEIRTPINQQLRFFLGKERFTIEKQQDFTEGEQWVNATEENIRNFSATAYFFAKHLQPEINVPVGLILVAVGGSNIEAWIPKEYICQIEAQNNKYQHAIKKGLKVLKTEREERIASWRANGEMNPAPRPLSGNDIPSSLFNGMVHPLLNLSIRGILWYQGESNAGNGKLYQTTFPMLIQSWRERFDDKRTPFIFAQLPNYRKPCAEPCESRWAELREAQQLALQLPNTGMAVLIDLGEADDIHPKNKVDVGKRLALAALRTAYEKPVLASGPVFKKYERKGIGYILTFDHTGAGIQTNDGKLPQEFAICGPDGVFRWAKAQIIGKNKIQVWSHHVKEPIAVRYAWSDNPSHVNTYNSEGLPMAPFRADSVSQ